MECWKYLVQLFSSPEFCKKIFFKCCLYLQCISQKQRPYTDSSNWSENDSQVMSLFTSYSIISVPILSFLCITVSSDSATDLILSVAVLSTMISANSNGFLALVKNKETAYHASSDFAYILVAFFIFFRHDVTSWSCCLKTLVSSWPEVGASSRDAVEDEMLVLLAGHRIKTHRRKSHAYVFIMKLVIFLKFGFLFSMFIFCQRSLPSENLSRSQI